ncbi:hypothetical protein JTE90_018143 [Oedothorax gibbosus]|uniref:Uncharacterized protein n=1 Tax=Oedothorax gibbosus TaxID=931172 RepID=A0AAV6V0W0_9ARAC|nr:hypothetical protein JTE90_018143 [Oedothorax gibbosus]
MFPASLSLRAAGKDATNRNQERPLNDYAWRQWLKRNWVHKLYRPEHSKSSHQTTFQDTREPFVNDAEFHIMCSELKSFCAIVLLLAIKKGYV